MDTEDVDALVERVYSARACRAEIQGKLDKLAAHLDITSLKLDAEGQTALLIGDEVPLLLCHFPDAPGVVAASPMPELEGETRARVLRQLLQANLDFKQTGGGVFGTLLPSGDVQLCRFVMLVDRDPASTADDLAQFVDDARTWVEQLELIADLPDGTGSLPVTDDGAPRPPTPDMWA